MKKTLFLGITLALIVSIGLSIAIATSKVSIKNHNVGEDSSVKIGVNINDNKFIVYDEESSYDLFKLLINKLSEHSDDLNYFDLQHLRILSINQKYSDFYDYISRFEFVVRTCSHNEKDDCKIINGIGICELSIYSNDITNLLSLFSMPRVEIESVW